MYYTDRFGNLVDDQGHDILDEATYAAFPAEHYEQPDLVDEDLFEWENSFHAEERFYDDDVTENSDLRGEF